MKRPSFALTPEQNEQNLVNVASDTPFWRKSISRRFSVMQAKADATQPRRRTESKTDPSNPPYPSNPQNNGS